MRLDIRLLGFLVICGGLLLSACTSVNTFPNIARPGDTISFMVGGSAQARKNNINVTLTDSSGQVFDLKTLGLVRSVFNLRPDGRAIGLHYSGFLTSALPWAYGHEPLQTVMVADLPSAATPGIATLTVTFVGVSDNSSTVSSNPYNIVFNIIPGVGTSEPFLRSSAGNSIPVAFEQLETAPTAKVDFSGSSITIGAASLVIDFDETVVNPNDLNLYVPESTVRGAINETGPFGTRQRMVYWHQDGQNLYVDIIAPQGIDPNYLQFYVVHPQGLTGSPAFSLTSAQVYGTDGSPLSITPVLTYSP